MIRKARLDVKRISFYLPVVGILLVLACETSDRPLTDPVEMYEKAVSLLQEKLFKQAKPLLEQAVSSFRDLNKTTQLIDALANLAQTEVELGEFRAAFDIAQQASDLMRKEGDVHGEVKITILQGDLYSKVRDYTRAIACYRTAMSSAMAFDDKAAAAIANLQIASILKVSGYLEDAQKEYKSVLVQAQASDNRQCIAAALEGIGSVYRIQQRYSEAVNSLTQGLTSTSSLHAPLLAAKLHTEIGLLHVAQSNANAALNDFRDAINTLRRARTAKEYETILLFQLGQVYEQNGKFPEAKRYYNDAFELARSQGDHIAENYLYIFLVRCNFNLMTPEQRIQNRDKLRQSHEQIAKKFQECNHVAGEGYLYTQIGEDYKNENNLPKARDYYLKAVTLDQNTLGEYCDEELHGPYQRALGIVRSHEDWYDCFSDLLIQMQQQEEALKVVECIRVKQLASSFQNLELSLRHPEMKQITRDVQSLLRETRLLEIEYAARLSNAQYSSDPKELHAMRREIDAAKQILRKDSKKVLSVHPNYETLVLSDPIDVPAIQKHIPQGALAIEFVPTDEQLFIFAINKSELVVRTSPIRHDSLKQLMTEYQRLLQNPSVYSSEASTASVALMTRFAMLSTQLYDLLLRPVDDLFDQSLIIVENEEMDRFPFHAIERQDRKGNVMYVIELTSVDYIPSLSSIRYRTTATSHIQQVIAFGNPTGRNWEVDYELRDIRNLFKGATVMVGLETLWDNLKTVKADVLQISTEFSHRNTELPLGTFALSNGLMVEQSTTLPFEKLTELNAIPVIVLSNYYGQGDGLSAAHALLLRLSGTSDIFCNAWLADRKAAKFFSEYFYTYLSNGLAPGDAYRQALLNLIRIREVSQPHSWAQFFHFGVG